MNDQIEQYKGLCHKLYDRTFLGSLHWQIDEWHNAPTTQLAGYTLKIERTENAEGEPIVQVSIIDANNQFVDGFSDETLAGMVPRSDQFTTFWKMLDTLYNMAWRTAKGADKALEAIIKDLDDDDNVPF